jgi:hypothetical protein
LAAGVFSLKVAGELRLWRSSAAYVAFDGQTKSNSLAARAPRNATERKEPHMPGMEVVELQTPDIAGSSPIPSGVRSSTQGASDLFARMDDMLGTDTKPSKNS